jgi:hypothetical protein
VKEERCHELFATNRSSAGLAELRAEVVEMLIQGERNPDAQLLIGLVA